jgi:hypothetical protein
VPDAPPERSAPDRLEVARLAGRGCLSELGTSPQPPLNARSAIVVGDNRIEYRRQFPYWRKRLEERKYDSIFTLPIILNV